MTGSSAGRDGGDMDIASIDEVLSTTRAVRRRLDLDRPVPHEVILECVDLAEQAPTGGNQPSRRWLVVTDADLKRSIADVYRRAAGDSMIAAADALAGTGGDRERTMASAAHLARHLQDVPALVIATIYGLHDGSGRPGLFDSVIQSAWSFCLALRARGLGTVWTTAWLSHQDEVAELLGIPAGVTQVVMLPVAYTVGDDFRPALRRPARQVVWLNGWGLTVERTPAGGWPVMADGPGVAVEADIEAPPERVWPVVTDLDAPAGFSREFLGAEWLDEPGEGARFVGRNRLGEREWEAECRVVEWAPGSRFSWHVGDPDAPGARWSFELEPLVGGTTRLRFSVGLGPGPSGLTAAINADPEAEADIVARRCTWHRRNMTATIQGIKSLAETPSPTGPN